MNPVSRLFRSVGLLSPQRSTPAIAVQPVDPAPKAPALTRRPEGAEFDAMQIFALIATPAEAKAWDGLDGTSLTEAMSQINDDTETSYIFANWNAINNCGEPAIDRLTIARKGPLFTFSHDRLMASVAVMDPVAPRLCIGWQNEFITTGGLGGCFQDGKAYVTGASLAHIYGAVARSEATEQQLTYAQSLLTQAREHPCSLVPPVLEKLSDEERAVRLADQDQRSKDMNARLNAKIAEIAARKPQSPQNS